MPAHNGSTLEQDNTLPARLEDGLVLRWATPGDAEALADFNLRLHSDDPDNKELWLAHWTRDLMSGRHPTTGASDFTIVEDPHNGGCIVSSLNLISQTWTYEGIPFGVGRIELVGTDPVYRRRGLVRRQMAAVHALSEGRGELVQAITGIPWYYRQFGYEMALNLGGACELFWARPGNDQGPGDRAYRIRPATAQDIPVLEILYKAHCAGAPIVHRRNEAMWQYELSIAHRDTHAARHWRLIEEPDGRIVAYVEHRQWGTAFAVREFGVLPGHSWRAVSLFLVQHLREQAAKLNENRKNPITNISFLLGEAHPAYEALGRQLEKRRAPYSWYLRVPSLVQFLRHIAPALQERLDRSVMAGHSGALRLNFYRDNMRLVFEKGELTGVAHYEPGDIEDADALFPDLTFLQLLFGYRSLDELNDAFADCYPTNAEAEVLLRCLFPRRPSDLSPLS